MNTANNSNKLIPEEFINGVIRQSFDYVRTTYKCREISDIDFVLDGILRVLGKFQSGRDWLQQHNESEEEGNELKRSSYFSAMHSARRMKMVEECALGLEKVLERMLNEAGINWLADFSELDGRVVIAVDGHSIVHASHAEKPAAYRHMPASTTVYALDLHSGLMRSLAPCCNGSRKSHEWKVFKSVFPEFSQSLKGNGRPIIIYDRAGVDNDFWSRLKLFDSQGAVVITRLKKNMIPLIKASLEFNADSRVNRGVEAVWMVGFDNSTTMRQIDYIDPETGTRYEFLTTNDDLEPGLVAWLYLMRWKIEKVFDTFKNKLGELKAWANGETAQKIQSSLIAMTRNILFVLRELLKIDLGIKDTKLDKKREKWLKLRELIAEKNNSKIHPFHYFVRPLYQLSQQFIRTVRNVIFSGKSSQMIKNAFTKSLTTYL